MTPDFVNAVMATDNIRLARYSPAQALQQIMNELDSDSDASVDDSGSDYEYEDHISEQSEVSDDEMLAFLGLCVLAGAYKSNLEPVSTLFGT
jgi:hypothetical protein